MYTCIVTCGTRINCKLFFIGTDVSCTYNMRLSVYNVICICIVDDVLYGCYDHPSNLRDPPKINYEYMRIITI